MKTFEDLLIKVISYTGVCALLSAFFIPLYKYEGFEHTVIMLLIAILGITITKEDTKWHIHIIINKEKLI